jgi:Histidine kinase-, DNA gyrase B-, and HSP90-like ATPase
MNKEVVTTHFASAERTDPEKLDQQVSLFCNSMLLSEVADAVPNLLMVLNGQREVVYANQQVVDILQAKSIDELKGKRPGELFNCAYADRMPGGCGTSEFCQVCGAVGAILGAQDGIQTIKECRLLTKNNIAYTMQAWATPYECNGDKFVIFLFMDVSDEKRRQSLERLFYHDIMNSAGGISGLASILMSGDPPDESVEAISMIQHAADRLIEEIKSHRQLAAAERGEVEINKTMAESIQLLQDVANTYARHEVADQRMISIIPESDDICLSTDVVLVRRVLGNMTKNALEATTPGETVTLGCIEDYEHVVFSVHNPCYMPRKIQLQMFQRSFSTKGSGRGIGTYSIKLFGEKYLGGQVSFTSSEEGGTTFYLRLPKGTASS